MNPEQTTYVREKLALYQEAGMRTIRLGETTSLDLFVSQGVFRVLSQDP